MAKKFSQRQAQWLRKRVTELEAREANRRRTWYQEWFGGTQIATVTYSEKDSVVPLAVRTARMLGHAVVAIGDDSSSIRLIALPHAKENA